MRKNEIEIINPNHIINSNVVVTTINNGKPALQIRKTTSNPLEILYIIMSFIYKKPLLVQIQVQDVLRARASLIEKGIIYYDPKRKNYFLNPYLFETTDGIVNINTSLDFLK